MDLIDTILKQLDEADISVKKADIEERINKLLRFKVPESEIIRSILVFYKATPSQTTGDNKIGPISGISDGKWTSLNIKVMQLWENNHDSIGQTGIVGDETGTVKFTKWASADLPLLKVDKCYTLMNVVGSVYNEKLQVSLNKKSKINELIEDIEVKENSIQFIGCMVAIQQSSGLITRCDECNKAIKRTCDTHPEAEGHYDLRIIGTIDNGQTYKTILADSQVTESITSISIESGKAMATEAMDKEVVIQAIKDKIIGKFYYISGVDMGDMILAKSMIPYVKSIPNSDLESLIQYIKNEAE